MLPALISRYEHTQQEKHNLRGLLPRRQTNTRASVLGQLTKWKAELCRGRAVKGHNHSHSRRRPSGPQEVYFTRRPKANRALEPAERQHQSPPPATTPKPATALTTSRRSGSSADRRCRSGLSQRPIRRSLAGRGLW